jgi:anaerobic selenocysteine-containing dehydrogenase
VPWTTPEAVFSAWQECSRGRPCDYTHLSYERLRTESGLRWGPQRLYGDGRFPSSTSECETYGHDLVTGAAVTQEQHKALRPDGRAFLKATPYLPAHEPPSDEFPLLLSTGRTVYHFHTRTKTRRSRELNAAAPSPWVELSAADAEARGIKDGDPVLVRSPRGSITVTARIGPVREGCVFAPFHYGSPSGDTQANELTMTVWDPVSKQPTFKTAACEVTLEAAGPSS